MVRWACASAKLTTLEAVVGELSIIGVGDDEEERVYAIWCMV
jgi:hypothetical protein